MTARNNPTPYILTDFDLKLLRVFRAIASCNGLTAAQSTLNLSLPTISSRLKQLEDRLGFKLCERGRKGFKLTVEGEKILNESNNLFSAVSSFQDAINTTKGQLNGDLSIGLVDALSTLNKTSLFEGFEVFCNQSNQVNVVVDIASPQDLLYGLTEGHYDCILTPMKPANPAINSVFLFSEEHHLYCGSRHPLFHESNAENILSALPEQPVVGRSYMAYPQTSKALLSPPSATVSHMESAIILIFTGQYLGYLPTHLGHHWEQIGRLKALMPDTLSFQTNFYLSMTKQRGSRIAEAFLECVLAHSLSS